jgi:hypothetical protein
VLWTLGQQIKLRKAVRNFMTPECKEIMAEKETPPEGINSNYLFPFAENNEIAHTPRNKKHVMLVLDTSISRTFECDSETQTQGTCSVHLWKYTSSRRECSTCHNKVPINHETQCSIISIRIKSYLQTPVYA